MLCALLGLALATLPGIGNPAAAASDALVVWVPEALAPAVRAEVATGFRGRAVTVVPTDVTDLRRALDAAEPGQEPDIVWAPGTATGELVGAGLVERLPLSQVLRDEFPPNVLDAFRFGFAYYGIPVQYENVALVVNRDLVPEALDSFADVERSARRLVNDDTAMVGIAVGQVPDGGAVALGPLFVGLGGYLFGRNPAGSLDPYNVGLNSAEFRSNADAIDRWNRNGLLSASLDDRAAQEAFLGGRAPFWLTGPRSTRVLDRASFAVEVVPVPPIAEGVTPASFVDVSGFMLTEYASQHGHGLGHDTCKSALLGRPGARRSRPSRRPRRLDGRRP
jgi:arabinogalactan oligomer/maltooligosaccharide transport system substrate-binding protein